MDATATLSIDNFLSILIPLLLYLIVTLIGALLKDRLNTIFKKDNTFRLNRILIGAICGAFTMIGIEPFLLKKFTMQTILCIAFIIGSVSFELFQHISNPKNFKGLIEKYRKIKEILASIDDVKNDNNDDNGGQVDKDKKE